MKAREIIREILIFAAIGVNVFLWGIQWGAARQDAAWNKALKEKLAEYQCVKKSETDGAPTGEPPSERGKK